MSVPFTVKLWPLPPPFANEMVDPEATEKQFGLNPPSLTVSVPVSLVAFADVLPPHRIPPPRRCAGWVEPGLAEQGVPFDVHRRRTSGRGSAATKRWRDVRG